MQHTRSKELFSQAKKVIPGGVNSPVRAFKSVGRDPVFIEKAAGSKIYDADGNSYIDYVGSWGPMILGHSHPKVVEAIKHAAENGSSFGAPTSSEVELAQMVCDAYTAIEKVRMVSSGTEATMSAIRLARGCTGRDKILKFEGCYHGHGDSLLVKAEVAPPLLVFLPRRESRPISPNIPSPLHITILKRLNNCSLPIKVKLHVSSSKPLLATWGVYRRNPDFLRGCGPCVTRKILSSSLMRLCRVSASPTEGPRNVSTSMPTWYVWVRSSAVVFLWELSEARRNSWINFLRRGRVSGGNVIG